MCWGSDEVHNVFLTDEEPDIASSEDEDDEDDEVSHSRHFHD